MNSSRNVNVKEIIDRKTAAVEQIEMAIRLFDEGQYACAITLALTAEDQLPTPTGDSPYLLATLRSSGTDKVVDINKIRNWLKHFKEPDEIGISELDVVFSILRATTKFLAAHRAYTDSMKNFLIWVKQEGFYSAEFIPSSENGV